MKRRELFMVLVVVVLGCLYVRYFTGWFIKPQMLIRVTQRSLRHRRGNSPPLVFILNDRFKLTSVEVIPITGETFNPLERPAWHLVTSSNSVPVRAFYYGQHIRGMKPAINAPPDPLQPGMPYRLLVAAGPVTGTIDFRMKGDAEN